jgi:hypothetical protein
MPLLSEFQSHQNDQYIILLTFDEEPNVRVFYHAYKEVNEQNYKQIYYR